MLPLTKFVKLIVPKVKSNEGEEQKPSACTCPNWPRIKLRNGSTHFPDCPIHKSWIAAGGFGNKNKTVGDGGLWVNNSTVDKSLSSVLPECPGCGGHIKSFGDLLVCEAPECTWAESSEVFVKSLIDSDDYGEKSGYTGERKDKLGRRSCWDDGKRVSCSKPPKGAKPTGTKKPDAAKPDKAKEKADKQAAVKAAIEKAFTSAREIAKDPSKATPEQVKAVGDALLSLTLPEIRKLKAELKVTGGGTTKAGNVEAIKKQALEGGTVKPTPQKVAKKPASKTPTPDNNASTSSSMSAAERKSAFEKSIKDALADGERDVNFTAVGIRDVEDNPLDDVDVEISPGATPKLTKIPISKIVTDSQGGGNIERIKEYAEGKVKNPAQGRPRIVHANGVYYLIDGNHRLGGAILRGDEELEVEMYEGTAEPTKMALKLRAARAARQKG